jgi:hypothetical protein
VKGLAMKSMHALTMALYLSFASIGTSEDASTLKIGCAVPPPPVNTFYCDPVNGTLKGDGSKEKPWGKLSEVIVAKLVNGQDSTSGVVHAGDRILLRSGDHGELRLTPYSGSKQYANTDFITIEADSGATPRIATIIVANASKWIFRGLLIEQVSPPPKRTMAVSIANSDSILIENCMIRPQSDVKEWTATEWSTLSPTYGVHMNRVPNSTVRNNRIYGVENGIAVNSPSTAVIGNTIDYFANDGIQFAGSDTLIQKNVISNHYAGWDDKMHHDGIQGWPASFLEEKELHNITIDSNFVIASTGEYPLIPPVPTGEGDDYLQGISIFDGTSTNVTVTNNIVISAANHGMSFYGISKSTIANNTVICQSPKYAKVNWLAVYPSKKGGAPGEVTIVNNIANYLVVPEAGVTFSHNLVFVKPNKKWNTTPVVDPKKTFVKYDIPHAKFDLRLAPGSPAIGAGVSRTGDAGGAPADIGSNLFYHMNLQKKR